MNSKLFYILLFLSIAVLSSCGERDYPLDEEIMVSFSFSTQENMTRAGHDWDDNLDNNDENNYDVLMIGSDYDSRIKFNSLRAFIYDDAGYVCEIKNQAYFELSEANYRFLGQIQLTQAMYERVKDKACKVMLVANSTLPEDLKDFDFNQAKFSVDNIKMPNGFIPMWGVKTVELNFQSNQDLGTIYLLRSAAKVEIKLNQSLIDAGFKIEDAFINKHAPNGYWFPTGWNSVGNTISLSHSGCYNPSEVSNTSQYFTKSSDSEMVIYLPEMATEGADITIRVKKEDVVYPFPNAIKFANYEGGSATETTFDIVRNHNYQYTITSVNTGASLELKCTVQPWTLDEETWSYSDVVTVSNAGHIKWIAGTVNEELHRVGLTPSSPTATFTFGLETPLGATWRAEFVTIKGKQNAFRFVEGLEANISADGSYATGNIGKLVTLVVGTTGTATIENNEAYLRILVILPDGRTIRVSGMLHHDENESGGTEGEGTEGEGTEGEGTEEEENQEYVIVQTP